jgi:molybdopterin-guanine dinucleotide biosynthesis protein A
MGRDKAWVEVAGQPLVHRVLAVAKEVAPVAGLVVSPGQAQSPAYQELSRERTIRLVPDRIAGLGPLGGLATALDDAGPEATVLLLAVDLPCLTGELLRRLLSIHREAEAALTVPLDHVGRPHPLAACYEGALGPLVDQLIARGERRLGALHSQLEEHATARCQSLPFSALSDLVGAERFFLNCNREEDLPAPEAEVALLPRSPV